MQEIEDADVKTKSEGDKFLQPYEKASPIALNRVRFRKLIIPRQYLPTRQFLLTNAMHAPDKTIKFRIPLDIISDSIPSIGDFPYQPGEVTWSGPTLFVKGEHSNYINRHNIPACKAFFPNMQLETLDAGHWVHAERPTEFVQMVERFIRKDRG
jgi:pimeloyl-ACP methyl ester carboxylesterase